MSSLGMLTIVSLPFVLAGISALALPAPAVYRFGQLTLVSGLNLLVVALLARAALL